MPRNFSYKRNEPRPESTTINGVTYGRAIDIALALGKSVWWIREQARLENIPSVKVGVVRYFNLEQVLAAMNSGKPKNQTKSKREPIRDDDGDELLRSI